MSGIYIHIPFCRQACHYCDFHFSTNLNSINEMVGAIRQELKDRKGYLKSSIKTIYYGGGTPSLLGSDLLGQIQDQIQEVFKVDDSTEVTLETNPEDLTLRKCDELKAIGFNRLSIGFQSFDNSQLQWMNRIHSSEQSYIAYQNARDSGFENISLDLIYALPYAKVGRFEDDLQQVIALSPEHVSLYGLTIEDRTVFGRKRDQGTLIEMPEKDAAQQYMDAVSFLASKDYLQYEVANFGRKGFHSKHNIGYWDHQPYLGAGPGAHSYDGSSRRFNIRHNAKYMKAVLASKDCHQEELLSQTQQINERILTGLRTTKGIDCERIGASFGIDLAAKKQDVLAQMAEQGLLVLENNTIKLTISGFLVADDVALNLFFHE